MNIIRSKLLAPRIDLIAHMVVKNQKVNFMGLQYLPILKDIFRMIHQINSYLMMMKKIKGEIDFLSTWLPEQLSDEEVEKIVDEVLSELGDVDMSQMGKIIGAVMAKADGLDGSTVSKIVKNKIS